MKTEWKIYDISDGDYGCEERGEDEPLRVIVDLVNAAGEHRQVMAYDEYLRWNRLDTGSIWEEPGEEKKQLFIKQKETLDAFLKTGALSPEQYRFSLCGLIVKMGFNFDILKEK